MKVKVYNKQRQRDEIGYGGHWVVRGQPCHLDLGQKGTVEAQAADIAMHELSFIRESLGTEYAVEIIV